MSSPRWLADNPALRTEPTSAEEIASLLAVVDRELADAQIPGLSADGKVQHAYNAALQCATTALRACGYRVRWGEAHHRVTIQSLEHTIASDPGTVKEIDAFRRKRSNVTYDRPGAASDGEARNILVLAKHLRQDVQRWLRENHPELMPS